MSKQTIVRVATAVVVGVLIIEVLSPTAGGVGQLLALKIFTVLGVI